MKLKQHRCFKYTCVKMWRLYVIILAFIKWIYICMITISCRRLNLFFLKVYGSLRVSKPKDIVRDIGLTSKTFFVFGPWKFSFNRWHVESYACKYFERKRPVKKTTKLNVKIRINIVVEKYRNLLGTDLQSLLQIVVQKTTNEAKTKCRTYFVHRNLQKKVLCYENKNTEKTILFLKLPSNDYNVNDLLIY